MISQPASHNKSGIQEARLLEEDGLDFLLFVDDLCIDLDTWTLSEKGCFKLHHYASIMTPLPAAM